MQRTQHLKTHWQEKEFEEMICRRVVRDLVCDAKSFMYLSDGEQHIGMYAAE